MSLDVEQQAQRPAPWTSIHGIYTGAVDHVSTCVDGGMMKNMLWMPGAADLVENVNQSLLTLRLERKLKVNCGVGRRAAQAPPVLRDGVPGVRSVHVVPTW